ncbi:MAG: hypothetical protein RJA98_3765 [Pseudomonadota bacterium]|jgi:ABC-type transport system substrate-binding protein
MNLPPRALPRRTLLQAAAACTLPGAAWAADEAKAGDKVLRYAFNAAETGFDPAQVSDLYSRLVTGHIFEAPYRFDHLARPAQVVPSTAAGMPETSSDFRTWTVRIQPGIYFADDPAFKGQRRELVAQDYVFSWKRFYDPALSSPGYSDAQEAGVLGLNEVREQALKTKTPFDYDREVEGLRALDRYTLQFKLAAPRPRFIYALADASTIGAVAREVVQAHGVQGMMAHPVGTGPFRLAQWRRSSQIVLTRNPGFRALTYGGLPAPDDAEAQALLARYKGRSLPMIDRVEISIIEESQPRWLSFLNGEFDLVGVPLEFIHMAAPQGQLAPHLAQRGVQLHRSLAADRTVFYFNMDDPLVGGLTPDKVALRRAIGLATDVEREITLLRRGQAIPAQSIVAPGTWGYDPSYRSDNSSYSPARAKALLDLFGYVDRNGDGWRDTPTGQPLVLKLATQPDATSRQFDELWKKNMDAIGVRLQLQPARWPENLKAARAGTLMMWSLGYSASSPDAQDALGVLYGPDAGGGNLGRFRHARFDTIYRQMSALPDGPERLALLREAQALVTALMPHKYGVHRIGTTLTQPWLQGYRKPPFGEQFWQYIDIDPARRPRP